MEGDDLAGDVAAVEGVAGGSEARRTAVAGGGLFLVGHITDCVRQVGLHELVANRRRPAFGR